GLLLHRACNEYTVSILSLEMSVGFMLFAGFAIAEELFQGYFPHRTMSWTDLLANFAGLSFFSLINEYFLSRPSNT
ncbi:MAG: VanZ family protein, partial [Myxococcota bacterium]